MAFLRVNLFSLAACLALFSAPMTAATALTMRQIAKGAFTAITEPKQEVIRDLAAWEKFWQKHSVNAKTSAKIPEIDFPREMVAVVTMGKQRTGGFTIEIISAEVKEAKLIITVKRKGPPPGAMVTQAITSPFHYVALPSAALKPVFVDAKGDVQKESN